MKRRLLIIALGVTFLIIMATLGTLIESITPRRGTVPTQTITGTTYQVSLQSTPNPPLTSQKADITVQVLDKNTQQPVSQARINIQAGMEKRNIQLPGLQAREQAPGTYTAQLQLTASGAWQITVSITTEKNNKEENITFELTAQ